MNATRWVTLSEFVKTLGRAGIARVDETEKGWFIAWIDSSPKALAKAEASMKKDRMTMSDEQRERLLIAEQIEKAKAETGDDSSPSNSCPPVEQGLKREEGEQKVVISLNVKPAAPTTEPAAAHSLAFKNPLKLTANPLKANPLKRPNPFKGSLTSAAETIEKNNDKKRPVPVSAAERLIHEDQERKRRRMEKESVH